MAKMNPETGRFQVSCEVNPGVYEKMLATIEAEGGHMSALVRRAVLRELRCDVNGNASRVDPWPDWTSDLVAHCSRCKSPEMFNDLEVNGGICGQCIARADA